MRVPLTRLDRGKQSYQHRGSASQYCDAVETFPGEIKIRTQVQREGNLLHLTIQAELLGNFICDRCGQPFSKPHQVQDDFYYSFDNSHRQTDPELPILSKGAVEIEVSQEIRDLVILGLPFQTICREDCKGLCPNCGADLNTEPCTCPSGAVDPRWAALQNLKQKP